MPVTTKSNQHTKSSPLPVPHKQSPSAERRKVMSAKEKLVPISNDGLTRSGWINAQEKPAAQAEATSTADQPNESQVRRRKRLEKWAEERRQAKLQRRSVSAWGTESVQSKENDLLNQKLVLPKVCSNAGTPSRARTNRPASKKNRSTEVRVRVRSQTAQVPMTLRQRLNEVLNMSPQQMKLMIGEATAQELRSIKAVLRMLSEVEDDSLRELKHACRLLERCKCEELQKDIHAFLKK